MESNATTGDGVVQIAYLHSEHVSHSWVESMRRMWEYDRRTKSRIARDPLNIRCSTGRLVPSRNYAAKLFLDKLDHEWLFFVDTDMGFEPDMVDRLLDVADPVRRPVVGALCFAVMEREFDGMGGFRHQFAPTLFKIGHTLDGHEAFTYYGSYPADTVCQVAATGAAALLIHRSALETLRKEHGDHWFDQMYASNGAMVGEDFGLCLRLGAAGIPINVHTGVKTTHHKEIWVSEEDYQVQQAVTIEVNHPEIAPHVHLDASLATLANNEHVLGGMLKLPADLDRYAQIIAETKPDVIVETGTRTGASARWFADQGIAVITVDISRDAFVGGFRGEDDVKMVLGDSGDPDVAARVSELVAGRRCMVSLDSDHSAAHVAKEIELYGPMVTPGCYLVVEDTIFGHAPPALREHHGLGSMVGSPLDAVAEHLAGNPDWSRDIAIERLSPTSHHPAGWWVKVDG